MCLLEDSWDVNWLSSFAQEYALQGQYRHDAATGDELVHSVVSQRANAMLARFKVNNTVHGGHTVNVIGQCLQQEVSQPCHCPQINNEFHKEKKMTDEHLCDWLQPEVTVHG